jgi:hypothetical protein
VNFEPELMYRLADAVCLDLDEVVATLAPNSRIWSDRG